MDRSPCRSCGAPMIWLRSASTGNLMCLDAEPVADGNIVILDGKAVVRKGDLFEENIAADAPRYKSHHATCPDAAKYRKPKK